MNQESVNVAAVTVLLAEDEALIRFVVAEELSELGWNVVEVGTADEGIALIGDGRRFDLVVTDINMPGKTDGLDLARRVRAACPSTKIAIMSGRPAAEARSFCDLFLAKPFVDAGDLFRNLLVDARVDQLAG